MKELDKLNDWLWKITIIATDQAMSQYAKNIHEPLYLYYTPAQKLKCGKIYVTAIPDTHFILVTNESIPRNRDRYGVRHWIRDHLNKLPIVAEYIPKD